MNFSLFKQALKDDAISSYHNAIHSYINNPFGDKTNIIADIIQFEIEQSVGKSALKTVIASDLTSQQFQIINKHIAHYKKRTVAAFITFTRSN